MRKFVCSNADIGRYIAGMNAWIDKLEKDPESSYIHRYMMPKLGMPFMKAFFHCNILFHKKEMDQYGIKMDEVSAEWVNRAMVSLNLEDLHFASHHLIWQMWDAARAGKISIPSKRMRFFAKVTEDCLEN